MESITHTRLIDSVLNDALCIVTRCLRPTPMDDLPILASMQPVVLRRKGATLCFAYRSAIDPDHIIHGVTVDSPCAFMVRLQ